MRRQLLVNGAILALALGTLGLVWATRESTTTAELESRKGKLLVSWDKDAVTRIVVRRGGQELVLERAKSSDDFRIVKPWPERADVATVNALLGSLDLASWLRPAEGVSSEQAKLGAKSLQIVLETGRNIQTLAVGGPAPAPAGARYAEVTSSGQPARRYVVSQGVAGELDVALDKFREPRLLEYGRGELTKIGITMNGTTLELVQQAQMFRLSKADGNELCDREVLERIFSALSRLTSERFVEPEAARSALSGDVLRVRLEVADKTVSPVSLTLGASCPGQAEQALLLREQPGRAARAGCISAQLLAALRVTPSDAQLKRPFSARPDEVEELSLAVGDQKLELARKGSAFLLRGPSSREVALSAGNQKIADVVTAAGERVAAPQLAALGLEPPAGEVNIRIAGADEKTSLSERVLLGKPRGDGSLCLKRATDDVVLCVNAEAAASFRPDATLLKSLDVLSFAPSELLSVNAEGPRVQQRLRRKDDGSYELEEPKGFRHDGASVANAVASLGTLRAQRWLSDKDGGGYGLDQPRLRVRVETASPTGPVTRELTVGADTSDGCFATLSPDPGVFVVSRASLALWQSPLIDRSLLPVAPADLERFELEAGKRRLVLKRHGDGWQAEGKSTEQAEQLAEALLGLRAETALHVGPATPQEGIDKPSLVVTFVTTQGTRRRLVLHASSQAVVYARLDSVDATFSLLSTSFGPLQDF